MLKKLLIVLTIFLSSFFLVNSSAKAATDYSTYFYEYDSEFVESTINHENFKTAYDKLMEYYTNGNYKNYLIYAFYFNNNIKLSILLFDTEDITINFNLENSYIGLSFTHGYEYNCTLSDLTCTTSAINRSKTSIISSSGGSNQLIDENIIKNTFLINDSRKFFIYESSTDKIYTKNPSIEHFKDSEGNILDKIPVAKDNLLNEYTPNQKDNLQLYSIDVYVSDKSISKFNFKINLTDYNDYIENNISKTDIDNFKFYGLKNDNKLYHWEEITDLSSYIDYEDDNYIINDNGFSFMGTTYLNFGNYEKIKLSISLKNALNYNLTYSDSLKNSDFDYNYFGSEYSKFVSNYKNNKYVIFSTKKENINGFIYIKTNNSNIFADYYNTETKGFSKFAAIDFYRALDNVNIYRFNYEHIGLKSKEGFYITNNKGDNFDYYIYANTDLYYSFNNNEDLNNSIFIDYNGNYTNSDLETYYQQKLTDIDDILDFVNKNNNTSNVFEFFGQVWNAFKVNNKIYIYLMLVISTSIAILVIKSLK